MEFGRKSKEQGNVLNECLIKANNDGVTPVTMIECKHNKDKDRWDKINTVMEQFQTDFDKAPHFKSNINAARAVNENENSSDSHGVNHSNNQLQNNEKQKSGIVVEAQSAQSKCPIDSFDGGYTQSKSGQHGFLFQVQLQMLFIKRVVDEKYEFSFGLELKNVLPFDDLVIRYKPKRGDWKIR